MTNASIWVERPTVDGLERMSRGTAAENLGIRFTGVGHDWLSARMPVDARTVQPYGILHGGASVLLAESLGSCGAAFCVDRVRFVCVGQEINANHVRPARSGSVTGMARPLHIGRLSQVWSIEIKNDAGRLTCISRLTVAVLPRQQGGQAVP